MSEIILLCGKVCAGKSFYARKLSEERNIVVLSVDELMLALFPERLGDEHNTVAAKAKEFLALEAEKIATVGGDVLLDFGFWFKSERDMFKKRFKALGHTVKLVYIDASSEKIRENAKKRNFQKAGGKEKFSYEADNALLSKCDALFEVPSEYECDEIILNM